MSVVIPLYNKVHTIRRAIDAVLAQEGAPCELIVVDDGSTDGSSQIAQAYNDRIKYIHQRNAGPSVARNRGVRESRYPVVTFLDADDEFLPGCLAAHIKCRSLFPDVRVSLASFRKITLTNGRVDEHLHDRLGERGSEGTFFRNDHFRTALAINVHAGSIAVDRDLFDSIGGFDEKLVSWEVTDLMLRLELASSTVGLLDGIYLNVYETLGSQSKITHGHAIYIVRFCHRVLDVMDRIPSAERPMILRQLRSFIHLLWISGATQEYKKLALRTIPHLAAYDLMDKTSRIATLPEFLLRRLFKLHNYAKGASTLVKRVPWEFSIHLPESPSPRSRSVGPVLLVSPWYKPTVGGVAEVAERLLRTFAANGIEVQLLIAHNGDGGIKASQTTPRVWQMASASAAFDHLSFRSILATAGRGTLAYWRLRRFIRDKNIRTVIILYPMAYAWMFLLLRRMTDVRLITSLHGNDVTKYESYEATTRWLLRHILTTSDAVITCADHLSRKARELCPGKTLHIELIPNCVDTSVYSPPPPDFTRSDSRPTFVHVSNFAPKKCTTDIVEAFADGRIPSEARLVMVGDGPDHRLAVGLARDLGVSDRVAFVGAQKDVRPFLWGADLFLLASDDEGAPLVLLEAMACGLPYVSTAWGPAAMLPPGECGLVVPSHSPRRLAEAMAELIANPQTRRKMGLQARLRAQTDFREDRYVERHLDLIRKIEQAEMNQDGTKPTLKHSALEQRGVDSQ